MVQVGESAKVGSLSCNIVKLLNGVNMTEIAPKAETATKKSRSTGAQAAVLAYFEKHPNQVLHLKDIAEDTGFAPDKVRSAINNLNTGNKADAKKRLKVEIRGQAWVWRSGKLDSDSGATLDALFVKVYESEKGNYSLAEDENGEPYIMKKLNY